MKIFTTFLLAIVSLTILSGCDSKSQVSSQKSESADRMTQSKGNSASEAPPKKMADSS